MKIFIRLLLLSVFAALISIIVGGVGWWGIATTQTSLKETAGVRLPAVRSLGQMMQALIDIKATERTALVSGLSLEERRREIGSFAESWALFHQGQAEYELLAKSSAEAALWKEFVNLLDKYETDHQSLVALVSSVELDDVETLEAILVARLLDHVRWVSSLDLAIAGNQKFTGQLDPLLCGLGRWLGSYRTEDAQFRALLAEFGEPHNKLHQLGTEINALMAKNEQPAARQLFQEQVKPTLVAIESVLDNGLTHVKKQSAQLHEGMELGLGQERESLDAAISKLEELSTLNMRVANEVSQVAVNDAKKGKIATLFAVLLGAVAVTFFGFFFSRSITGPLRRAIRIIEKIALGDTSERMPMGKPVNCSSLKKCGRPECPSFGKVDHCWVTSGSLATIKSCPRAQKGEDCRTCEAYGAKTEIDELGSIIGGLAEGLAHRKELTLAIANGDLTRKVELASPKDELGQGLQIMAQNLREIIGEIKTAGAQIASGAGQVADASQSLSQGATEQASAIEEITSSMVELGSHTKQNAEGAVKANELAGEARTVATRGNEHMREMTTAMSEISTAGKNISKIIKVIDEIAFQTNLLALNAAVEAARAGRHGKGFAVVADGVRNLAARSANAARETADLIASAVQRTESGTEIANRTAIALGQIVTEISKVSDLVGEIAVSSNDQAQGIAQVNQGLGQIDQVTQQNTASAEESAAASEELSAQAAQLEEMLTRFKL